MLTTHNCWIFCPLWCRDPWQDGLTSLPEDSDPSEGEVLRMSSALPTMWLGAQNGWWAGQQPLEGAFSAAATHKPYVIKGGAGTTNKMIKREVMKVQLRLVFGTHFTGNDLALSHLAVTLVWEFSFSLKSTLNKPVLHPDQPSFISLSLPHQSVCPLVCGSMEEVSPCHKAEGLHPWHSVSTKSVV